jgi:hypothetical protein
MIAHVIALLDKPRPLSFGKFAFVTRDAHGELHIHSLRNHPRSTLTADELEQLVASQSVLRLHEAIGMEDPNGKVAGWLGREFQERLRWLAAPSVRELPSGLARTPDGDVWFEGSARVYDRMEAWMNAAARDVFTGKSNARELAELMLGVLPDRDETRAAVWYTRPNDAEKVRHLKWYARLERDAGRPVAPAALEERFLMVRDTFRTAMRTRRAKLPVTSQRRSMESPPFLALTA